MTDAWPLVGRDDELRRLGRLLRDADSRGVVVAGGGGVGRSRLLAEFLRTARAQQLDVVLVTATRSSAATSLGVFSGIAPAAPIPSGSGDRFERARQLASMLLGRAQERRLIFAVDDAHLLDDDSAALLLHLARSGSVVVVATVRTGWPAPDAVHALSRDDVVARLDLEQLGPSGIAELLEAGLGGPVDTATLSELSARSQGDLHVLRELALGAIEHGDLVRSHDFWRLVGSPSPSIRLIELVEVRLAGLTAGQREVLEVVAFADMVTATELGAVADLRAAEGLEAVGLVAASSTGDAVELRVAQPAVRDVLRAVMPALRRQRIAVLLDGALRAGDRALGDAETLRVAAWHLDSGAIDPAEMLGAARLAQRTGQFAAAERFARAASGAGGGFDAALLAAQLTSLQGRAGEAERALVALFDQAQDDMQRSLVTATRVNNQLFYLGLAPEGAALAQKHDHNANDPQWEGAAAAARAGIVLNTEGPEAAAEAAEPMLTRVSGQGLALARLVCSYSLGRMGRLNESISVALAGERSAVEFSGATVGLPFLHVFHRCDALAFRGQLAAAEDLAEQRHAAAVTEHASEQRCIFAFQLVKTVGDRGHVQRAVRYGQEAVAMFEELGRPQYQAWCLQYLALAHALGGDAQRARATLRTHDALGTASNMVMAVDLHVARGWSAVADADLSKAREHLEEGAALGVRIGDRIGAITALHSLARLGLAGGVVSRLREVAAGVEGPLTAARIEHVCGLAEQDCDALVAVAERFSEMGADILAAEASADAAVALRRQGRARRAARAEYRTGQLAERCAGVSTPALQTIAARVILTDAERTTALLAARGRSSPEIAAELTISVRTVEGRLQRAYEKLGVHSRDELAHVLTSDRRRTHA